MADLPAVSTLYVPEAGPVLIFECGHSTQSRKGHARVWEWMAGGWWCFVCSGHTEVAAAGYLHMPHGTFIPAYEPQR